MTERRFPVLLSRLSLPLGLAALASAASAAPRLCKPTLSIKDAQFSKWELPSMERRWTATVAVDASRCTANASGYFEIGFLRAKEYGMDLEFREQFVRRFAEYVDQYVQSSPVGHSDHHLFHAVISSMLDGLVQQGYQAVTAFK